jgi:ATP-binding cassette subfamily B protein
MFSVVFLFLFLNVLKSIALVVTQYFLLRTKFTILHDVIVDTFRDIFESRWDFFTQTKQGVLINTFTREINTVGDSIGALSRMGAAVLQVIFYLALPLYVSWQITSISFLTAIILSLPLFLLHKTNARLGAQKVAAANEYASLFHEYLVAAKTVLGFGKQGDAIEKMRSVSGALRNITLRSDAITTSTPFAYEPLGIAAVVLAILYAKKTGTALADIGIIIWSLKQIMPHLGQVISQRNLIFKFRPSFEQVQKITKDARECKQQSGDLLFQELRSQIKVSQLSFCYENSVPVLTDINLEIPMGRMVAVVGASGSGKTTLVDLIMGFYLPQSGEIEIDGVSLAQYDVNSFRRRIGYVPQDSVLFNTSIKENLKWSSPNSTDGDLEEACTLANAHEFIIEFPDGYDTLVGDRGVRLSGGQRQRISLARAILRKPDLLILDEATSSLDTQSERLIQKAVEDIAKKTTVVAIAHRLSTIVNADYVYVLSKGRIVEEGLYQDLIGEDGHFSKMVELQSFV